MPISKRRSAAKGERECVHCGRIYPYFRIDQYACDSKCKQKEDRKRAAAERKANPPPKRRKECQGCGEEFEYERGRAKCCSEECSRLVRLRAKVGLEYRRTCRQCGNEFTTEVGESRGVRIHHCSDECARISARKSKAASHKRAEEGTTAAGVGRPRTLSDAERALRRQLSVSTRFFVRYPWIDKACQACGERRVVELAHKVPRLSAWRTAKNTTPADVWVLCPTCHRVLDYGIETAEQLGLWDLPSEAPLKAA